MDKQYLLAPGPTPVPPEVLQRMAEPIIHHRAPAYEKVLEEVREGLKYLFQTKNEVLIFSSSGTGAMEGAVTNTLCAGDKALVVEGGKFGERWANICKAYGVKAEILSVEWGQGIDPALIAKALQADPSIKAVFTQATETSTGVLFPIREIAAIVSGYPGTIMVVDAISHLGAVELPMDEWKLDVVVAGSQKALMLPPGLAFAALSDKAWEFVGKSTLPRFYFDFKKELKNLTQNQSAYTPAVSLVMGLAESLKKIRKEGLENVFARHAKLARATREAMLALGLTLYAPQAYSNAVTAAVAPPGVDAQKVVKILRDKHNLTIAGGQDQAKGKIFRIAHLGYVDKFDVIMGVAAVEMTLKELGYDVEMGKGVRAAMGVLTEK
ncbi:MAG: alanine--glyoxylate aminotransferase family protein [Deltaproteobacteria bacterium]|nr:alanine--glyoxylate aminotransferase family protein [Deltaproteobacteria bacterium]